LTDRPDIQLITRLVEHEQLVIFPC